MHHLKETTIDGVKFVLIPEELHDKLAQLIIGQRGYNSINEIALEWERYDPEVFGNV